MPEPGAIRHQLSGISSRPVQYMEGRAYFRHLELIVDERVLIPRPETEVVVDWALRLANAAGGIGVDIGTGSGAIALSLALEGAFDRIIATDVSSDAIDVARANLALVQPRLSTPVELRHGSFLAPVMGIGARLLVSNPPYIAARELVSLPANVRGWEPPAALVSGDDGLAATATIIEGAHSVLERGGWLVLETDSTRAADAERLVRAQNRYSDVAVHSDLTGRDRVLVARLRG